MVLRSKKLEKIHGGKPKRKSEIFTYKCVLCKFETSLKGRLAAHVNTHSVGVSAFTCPQDGCYYRAMAKITLKLQSCIVHSGTPCTMKFLYSGSPFNGISLSRPNFWLPRESFAWISLLLQRMIKMHSVSVRYREISLLNIAITFSMNICITGCGCIVDYSVLLNWILIPGRTMMMIMNQKKVAMTFLIWKLTSQKQQTNKRRKCSKRPEYGGVASAVSNFLPRPTWFHKNPS